MRMKFDFLVKQLDLAHRRNDLVDNLRYSILRVFFTFQAVILGAFVFKRGNFSALKIKLDWACSIVPILVFVIGWSLYSMYVSWHFYLYRYKAWISSVDTQLRKVLDNQEPDLSKGTYYGQEHGGSARFEPVFIFTAISMIVLNIGTSLLLGVVVDFSTCVLICGTTIALFIHIASIIIAKYSLR